MRTRGRAVVEHGSGGSASWKKRLHDWPGIESRIDQTYLPTRPQLSHTHTEGREGGKEEVGTFSPRVVGGGQGAVLVKGKQAGRRRRGELRAAGECEAAGVRWGRW